MSATLSHGDKVSFEYFGKRKYGIFERVNPYDYTDGRKMGVVAVGTYAFTILLDDIRPVRKPKPQPEIEEAE